MKFSRFERKILAAMVGVALVPMVGALFLGQAVLREAYAVGVNTRVGDQLERGLALYQVHFTVLRRGAEQAATAIAHDFFFDYSTIGIPSAPNSGGTTRGMKLQANLSGDVFGGFSVSPTGENFSGDYTVSFEVWWN